jgi:hypothetical protein
MHSIELRGQAPEIEQKRAALTYLHEAWVEARTDGIDGDCLAQACLFAAFAEFVSTYGEEAAAGYAEGLAHPRRRILAAPRDAPHTAVGSERHPPLRSAQRVAGEGDRA